MLEAMMVFALVALAGVLVPWGRERRAGRRRRAAFDLRALARGGASAAALWALGGCLSPGAPAVEDLPRDVARVQSAVDAYVAARNALPVARPLDDADRITGVPLDMSALYPTFLDPIPSSAFERGGVYRYVLVPLGEGMAVRLADLRIADAVERVQRAVAAFHRATGRLPVAEEKGPDELVIDYGALHLAKPALISPYSGHALGLMLTRDGRVYADYLLDLALLLRAQGAPPAGSTAPAIPDRAGAPDPSPNGPAAPADAGATGTPAEASGGSGDLRRLFVERTLFVPVASVPYGLEGGEPVLRPDGALR
ncbi:hypothetical protein [Hydrogenibacillus sp. N12]|uniref:hypothetical protein n=1 Tax=Hydrogenibacillus sp. N12 TaxID=2866627 RepID=UPI001C7CCCFC|nr:hypothetical protein [Hydrogenibacillus sp. N12]QZA32348.1 hypothetical protein K2M58_08425 [Hydrogenibacillus sp. N12]